MRTIVTCLAAIAATSLPVWSAWHTWAPILGMRAASFWDVSQALSALWAVVAMVVLAVEMAQGSVPARLVNAGGGR